MASGRLNKENNSFKEQVNSYITSLNTELQQVTSHFVFIFSYIGYVTVDNNIRFISIRSI